MIDTVRQNAFVWASPEPPAGWTCKTGVTQEKAPGAAAEREWVAFQHESTGLRLFGNPTGEDGGEWLATKMEVSLPRLVHGSNGVLLKNQAEIDQALAKMRELALSLVVPGREHFTRLGSFSRVDLVWQFRGNPAQWIGDLSRAYHPSIRRAKVIYEGESVHFPGIGRHLRIYDKQKESKGSRGNVVRCELQLSKKPLIESLGNDDPFKSEVVDLHFGRAYSVYREFLSEFEPITKPHIGKMVEFLAYCQKEKIRDPKGRLLFDLWASNKHPVYVRAMKGKIQKTPLTWEEFSFRSLLPEDGPPEAVDFVA